MNEAILVLGIGLAIAALFAGCDRGIRIDGISWFDIAHPTNRKSRRS